MDVSGDVADLMVKESIQLTEASIKLLAAGSKNLAAFLWALSKDNKKLVGKTHMARLLREGKELKVFRIKESDLAEFRAFAKKNVLFCRRKGQPGRGRYGRPCDQRGFCVPSQPVHGAPGLWRSRKGPGGGTAKKSRPPRSARALLTTAREWLDTIAEQEDDDEDDEDY